MTSNYKDLTWHQWHSIRWHILQTLCGSCSCCSFMLLIVYVKQMSLTLIFHLSQHPRGFPAAAGVASAHSHRSVRAPHRGAAQTTPQGSLWDRGQPRGSQSPYWRSPGGPGGCSLCLASLDVRVKVFPSHCAAWGGFAPRSGLWKWPSALLCCLLLSTLTQKNALIH